MLDIQTALLTVAVLIDTGVIFFLIKAERPSAAAHQSFVVFMVCLVVWTLLHIGFRVITSDASAEILLKLSYVSALGIGASFYYFSIVFPEGIYPPTRRTDVLILITAAFSIALLMPGFLIAELRYEPYGRGADLRISDYIGFALLFLFLFIGGQIRLWFKVRDAGGVLRNQLLAITGSVTVVGMLGIYFDLFLPSPLFENFRYIWMGPVLTSVFALTVTYAIFRYRLFNVEAAVTELLVFAWWIVVVVRALLASPIVKSVTDQLLVVLSAPIGTLLLRSLKKGTTARPNHER